MVHEGDTYFERCYAADFNLRIRPEQREACWQAWVAHYTRHQPAHRVDYALRRIEALQNGEPALLLPGLPASSAGKAVEIDDAGSLARAQASLSPVMQGDGGPVQNGCLTFCNDYESRCVARCPGNDVACHDGCQRERALCLQGCY